MLYENWRYFSIFFKLIERKLAWELLDFIMKFLKVFKNMQIILEKAHCIYT